MLDLQQLENDFRQSLSNCCQLKQKIVTSKTLEHIIVHWKQANNSLSTKYTQAKDCQ